MKGVYDEVYMYFLICKLKKERGWMYHYQLDPQLEFETNESSGARQIWISEMK